MLNDDEENKMEILNDNEEINISSSQIIPVPDDANKAYQTEATLCSLIETNIIVTEEASQSKYKEGTVPDTEKVIFESEEVNAKEIGKHNNVELDDQNGSKAITSSLRIIFHEKKSVNISNSQLSPKDCDTIKHSSQSKDGEDIAMPVAENFNFVSEEEKSQGNTMEDGKIHIENDADENKIKESNSLGEENEIDDNDHQKVEKSMDDGKNLDGDSADENKNKELNELGEENKMDNNDHQKKAMEEDNNEANEQARVSYQISESSKNETSIVEKSGLSSQKKKVLKKVDKPGMIFMCSKKTKQDCFDYKVFGLPASKRDVVRRVSKGMRLFLFDIDLRVMYGVYKAVAPGDYNIEPNAFKSAFPSQVRFAIVKDCTPLAEEKFRTAIKDNYYRKNMFNCDLIPEQVRNLCKLFISASKGPSLSLKNDDVIANSSQTKELSSIPIDIDIEENGGKIKQENPIEEEMDKENAMVSNKGKLSFEKNEEAVTEEEKKNKENIIVEANGDEEKIASEEEKGSAREKEENEDKNERDTGMIFMCSSKTKQDCLHYKVLGLPANKREIVEKVEKGMKLFMFDVNLRLMYGIYKATGSGGYNIEPKAFNSSFPAQVQFTVVNDCPPLTEEKFRMAIKDNYYRKNKFKFQLTSDQVKKLSQLFVAASESQKQEDAANISQSKVTLSKPMDMNIEGIYSEVKQADQNEEAINEENAIVGNIAKTNLKDENEEIATEEEKNNENDVCLDEESGSEEEEKEAKIEEEIAANSPEKIGKKRKRREKKLKTGNTGMIFMCSSKTKPDCLHYKVLGLPANKREVVEKIQKGTRLFMFDVELRVMYGIYKAAGPGGYNIEPKAFNSGFPSQVRFAVVEDCLPLEEEKFKAVIKDNYFTKWKFNCELTSEQVKNLCKLFSANKGRGRTRQQNNNISVAYEENLYQERTVQFSQFPPPAYAPPHGLYTSGNVYMSGPPFQSRIQRHGRKRPGHSYRN